MDNFFFFLIGNRLTFINEKKVRVHEKWVNFYGGGGIEESM